MIGNPLTILDRVESSNNYATGQAVQGLAHHGHGFLARFQTAGKGQRGKSWQGTPGQNIALSVVLDMKGVSLNRNFELSMAIALGVYDFFSHFAGHETRIKWPNDLYWCDRKAVGILIDNTIKGQNWQWAIAGMGINMNQTTFTPQIESRVVSLRQITGKTYDIESATRQLCIFLETRYQQFLHTPAVLLAQYNELLFKRHEKVSLLYKAEQYNCLIEAVDAQGRLWIQGAPVPYFQFGEVTWILDPANTTK